MIRLRASATTAALIAAVIVMITTAALLQLFYFSRSGAQRDAELNQARWYLEGKVQETMDGWITSRKSFHAESWNETTHYDDKEVEIRYQLSALSNSIYRFQASMVWNGRYNLKQRIEFKRINPFDYTLFFNGSVGIKLQKNTGFSGSIGLTGPLSLMASTDISFCLPDNTGIATVYFQDIRPNIKTSVLTNSISDLIKNPEMDLKPLKTMNSSGIRTEKRNLKIPLPTFDMAWNSFFEYRDPNWFIGERNDFDKLALINPQSTEKELIGIGDGLSTRFTYPPKKIIPSQIYIKKITARERYQNIESLNFSYTYGVEQPERYFDIAFAGIRLKASEEPTLWILPDSAYSVLGNFDLAGGDWSLLSQDEKLEGVYLNRPALITSLKQGEDYRVPPGQKTIQVIIPDFAAMHSSFIGTGNGTKKFPCALYPDQQFIYIGNKRTFEFTLKDQAIEFARPPAAGEKILAFSIPPLYIKKAPPVPKTGVFIDRIENASVLDLTTIQNGPENGVLFSTTPLVVRGNCPIPLVIICTENIYLEDINTGNNGSPVMILSKKGVWIFQRDSKKGTVIKQAMIYSPLKKLDTVTQNPLDKPHPSVIIGCGVFTFENARGVLDNSDWYSHWFYDGSIRQSLQTKPFVWMPMPLEILSVRRD